MYWPDPPSVRANAVKTFSPLPTSEIEYFNLLGFFASSPLCTGLKIRKEKEKSEFLLLGMLYQSVFFFSSGTSQSDLGVHRTMETSALEVTGCLFSKLGTD